MEDIIINYPTLTRHILCSLRNVQLSTRRYFPIRSMGSLFNKLLWIRQRAKHRIQRTSWCSKWRISCTMRFATAYWFNAGYDVRALEFFLAEGGGLQTLYGTWTVADGTIIEIEWSTGIVEYQVAFANEQYFFLLILLLLIDIGHKHGTTTTWSKLKRTITVLQPININGTFISTMIMEIGSTMIMLPMLDLDLEDLLALASMALDFLPSCRLIWISLVLLHVGTII